MVVVVVVVADNNCFEIPLANVEVVDVVADVEVESVVADDNKQNSQHWKVLYAMEETQFESF